MQKPTVIAIAALGKDTLYIGVDNTLLWNNPEDLRRLKAATSGHPIIMGRKTHESIGRALPNRTNIILTRNPDYTADGCYVVTSTEAAMELAKTSPGGDEKIFIFGGAEIYALFLDQTDSLLLTLVHSDKQGTHKFPDFREQFVESERYGSEVFEGELFEWIAYTRK